MLYVTGTAVRTEDSTGNKKTRSSHLEFTFKWNKQTKNHSFQGWCLLWRKIKQTKGVKECRGGLFWMESSGNVSLGWYLSRQLKAMRRSDERTFLGEKKRKCIDPEGRKSLSCSEDSKMVRGAKIKWTRGRVTGDKIGEEGDHTEPGDYSWGVVGLHFWFPTSGAQTREEKMYYFEPCPFFICGHCCYGLVPLTLILLTLFSLTWELEDIENLLLCSVILVEPFGHMISKASVIFMVVWLCN